MANRGDGYCSRPGQECVRPRGHRRFVVVKTKEGNLVADVRPYAVMRERVDTDYQ